MALVLGIGLAVLLSRAVAGPVTRMTAAMKDLAGGNRDVIIPGLGYRDEIGSMAEAVQVFKNNAIEKERLEAAQEEQKRRADEERKLALRKMADGFESQVGTVVDAVTSAAVQLQASSRQMAATATETSAQATSVAARPDRRRPMSRPSRRRRMNCPPRSTKSPIRWSAPAPWPCGPTARPGKRRS